MAKRRKQVQVQKPEEPPKLPKYIQENRPTPKEGNEANPSDLRQCPRCKGYNTVATSTRKFDTFTRYHRVCRSAVCYHRFKKIVMKS